MKRLDEEAIPARSNQERFRGEELGEEGRSLAGSVVWRRDGATLLRHYLYFTKRDIAESAAKLISPSRYTVEVRLGGNSTNWLVLVTQADSTDEALSTAKKEFETVAADLGGEYDGYELKLR